MLRREIITHNFIVIYKTLLLFIILFSMIMFFNPFQIVIFASSADVIEVEYDDSLEIICGVNDSISVDIKNILDNSTLNMLTIDVSSDVLQEFTISPMLINEIKFNETEQLNIAFFTPVDLEEKNGFINITISGEINVSSTEIEFLEIIQISFDIYTISIDELSLRIENLKGKIIGLEDLGFSINKTNNILEDALEAFANQNYDRANALCNEIDTICSNAILADELINQISNSIDEHPYRSLTDTKAELYFALAAFDRGDFNTALFRAENAMTTFKLETNEFDFFIFIFTYWWAVIFIIIMLAISGFLLQKIIKISTITKRIKKLVKEEDNIKKLIIDVQKKHFDEKTLSTKEYRQITKQHQKKLSKIKKLIAKLRHRRVKLMRSRDSLKDLDEENEEIIKIIKNLQKDYFQNHKITKKNYSDQLKSYYERISEIEAERLTLELMLAKGEKKQ